MTALPDFMGMTEFSDARIVPLKGDASTRQFKRLITPQGKAAILMIAPERAHKTRLYVELAKSLKHHHIPVPDIYLTDSPDDPHYVVMEDVGECHFWDQARIEESQLSDIIDLLIGFGSIIRSQFPVSLETYDRDYFLSQALFLPHILKTSYGFKISDDLTIRWTEEWRHLLSQLVFDPVILTMRDFHGENIMVKDGRLGLIDFQDTAYAPIGYDILSFCQDVRHPISQAQEEALKHAYFEKFASRFMAEAQFLNNYDLFALVRHIRVLAVFLNKVHEGADRYARYIPDLFVFLKRLFRNPRFAHMEQLLEALYPEQSRRFLNF